MSNTNKNIATIARIFNESTATYNIQSLDLFPSLEI